jgi:DNA repair protein RecN (Recombination protein N)
VIVTPAIALRTVCAPSPDVDRAGKPGRRALEARAANGHKRSVLATLSSLRIRNLALVEDLTWEIGPGFTAITGETGSGKSIIVGALNLVLGERADKTLVRTGAESCMVEAAFHVHAAELLNRQLAADGIEPCEDDQLIVKRIFTTGGTNRQFINGSATTLAVLNRLGDMLVDLHGPHDHQSLLASDTQLALLDAFAGAQQLYEQFRTEFVALQRLRDEQTELSGNEGALERELDLLRHQTSEIENARLRPDEEGALQARFHVASNARRLFELSMQTVSALVEAEGAVAARAVELRKSLRELERIDSASAHFLESLNRGIAEFESLAAGLQRYADELEIEPGRLAQMEERVNLLEQLKRKYGGSIEAVIAFGEDVRRRLATIESRGERLQSLAGEIIEAENKLRATGRELSKQRAAAAPKLGASVTAHLRDLGFARSELSIVLQNHPFPGPRGMEEVAFMFAPNPGEPPKSLKAIASSGEISRVMLALKSALAAQDTISLLVFDEIDANVGGEIAHAVGAKMKFLGSEHQVLCITHLPQVAAQATAQFVVTKSFSANRTISDLAAVTGKARVEEIARMLGGGGASALAHARTLLGK